MLSNMDVVRCACVQKKPLIMKLTVHSRLLAQHPHVLNKLRREISSTVGVGKESRLPDRNSLKKMKYLSLVFKEGVFFYLLWILPSRDDLSKKDLPTNSNFQYFDSTLPCQSILAPPFKPPRFQQVAVLTAPSL